jgi:hypothetical protein
MLTCTAQPAFFNNISVSGGPAPVRAYITELLPEILEGKIQPGRVFDRIVNLDEVPRGLSGHERSRVHQSIGNAVTSDTLGCGRDKTG